MTLPTVEGYYSTEQCTLVLLCCALLPEQGAPNQCFCQHLVAFGLSLWRTSLFTWVGRNAMLLASSYSS